ncbi:MAG: hypothetical protein AAF512_02315 [Pseudomonadota bacterium]
MLAEQNPQKLTEYTFFHPSLLQKEALQNPDQRFSNPTSFPTKPENLKAFLKELKVTILEGFQPHAANEFTDVTFSSHGVAKHAEDIKALNLCELCGSA